jgi:hypothetical protein
MDLVCLMMYGIIYMDLEMYYERYIRLYEIDKSLQKTFFFFCNEPIVTCQDH